ncbi:hypothetical protein LTR62_002514 [Meristemomyces frigidus]|uniref:Rhodopsin domain-containing protein n=1 Tax=Meristemomyces frigidus TaxID=1508187 RepID=A0AAN7TFY2_9PEZI|nr:hypothetical protein LTR62_002514 [Meristemomyces frigidus]
MVSLRLWLRASRQAGDLGFDDALIFVAWLAGTVFSVTTFLFGTDADLGRHTWDIPLTKFEDMAKLLFIAELNFLVCQGCTKISVLLFYRRLVKDTYAKIWKWAVIGAITFTALWTLAFILVLVFNCNPTEAYWKAFEPTYTRAYTCVDTTIVNVLVGCFAIVADLYSVALPCVMTRRFELPGAQKLALNALFSIGLVVVGAGAVRTYYLYRVGTDGDVAWQIFNVVVWSQLELQLGITCACLPAMRVLIRRYLHVMGSGSNSNMARSQQSKQDQQHVRLGSITRVNGPNDRCYREDFSMKRMPSITEKHTDGDDGYRTEQELSGSPSSTSPSTTQLYQYSGAEPTSNSRPVQDLRHTPDDWPLGPRI